jgi:hypothetical protein
MMLYFTCGWAVGAETCVNGQNKITKNLSCDCDIWEVYIVWLFLQ